jgi:hypothetical protein
VYERASGCRLGKTFTSPGTKYVRLLVRDADGDVDAQRKSFTVAKARRTAGAARAGRRAARRSRARRAQQRREGRHASSRGSDARGLASTRAVGRSGRAPATDAGPIRGFRGAAR